jgi:methionine-rich copper-binding protein CopC
MTVRFLARHAFAAALSLLGVTAAYAHAHLDHAVPAEGSTIHTAPTRIELSFSERVEPAFSVIEVLDQKGDHVEQGKPTLDPTDAKTLTIAIKLAPMGTYKVVWRVISVDTHRSSGTVTFSVAPGQPVQ